MSIREKSGRWYFRFKIHGKPYEGSTGLPATRLNENAAKLIEAQKRLEAIAGQEVKSSKDLPFRVAAAEFLRWCHSTRYRQKPNTAHRIQTSFASLLHFFGEKQLLEIEPLDIERFKTWRAENFIKDVTIRNDLNALSLFFRYCRRAKWRTDNPLLGEDKVERPSGENAMRTNIVSAEDEEKYFAVAKGNLHDCAKLILLQGARPDEILSLRKSSYNRTQGTIEILGGKTKSARRTLYLCGESMAIIESRLSSPGPWLFPARDPKHHVKQLHTGHDSACQTAGVSFVLYDLRHTFATRQLTEAKTDMASLAAIMGHSSLRILQKYAHPTADHQREAMKQYEASRPKAKLQKIG